jgi:pantetheine-phosphate adenylyltransferase
VRIAVYPGSFDPITHGHLDVVRRAVRVFDRVIVAVLANPRKSPLLDAATRVEVIRASIADDPLLKDGVEVRTFDGLTVDFCHEVGAGFLIRGLRAIADFENELQLAHNNHQLAADIDTVLFMTSLEHSYISSSLVKEIAHFGGDVSAMLPVPAVTALGVANDERRGRQERPPRVP